MAAIIATVQLGCLKTKPEGTPAQIVSTAQHIPNTRFGKTVVNERCPAKAAMIQSKKSQRRETNKQYSAEQVASGNDLLICDREQQRNIRNRLLWDENAGAQ